MGGVCLVRYVADCWTFWFWTTTVHFFRCLTCWWRVCRTGKHATTECAMTILKVTGWVCTLDWFGYIAHSVVACSPAVEITRWWYHDGVSVTERRCWKAERFVRWVQSKHFSRVWVLDLGHWSFESASKIFIERFVPSLKIFVGSRVVTKTLRDFTTTAEGA